MTALLAATATATPDRPLPWATILTVVAVALLLGALYYIAECAWWPFAHCRRCEGRGKFARDDGKVWRRCRRCKGSGSRLRLGRKVWNRFARVRRAAQ